jgi:hypothetical protein
MATAPTTTWTMTVAELCKAAAVELGALDAPSELEDGERDQMFVWLNSMLNQWAVEANMFRDATTTLTVLAGTGTVELPADALIVNAVAHVISPTYSRQLFPWNRSEYYSLPNRAQTGNPTIYYLSKTPEAQTLNLWPVPTADITLALDYGRSVFTVEDVTGSIDVPKEWQGAVMLGLAARCASMFGATRIDPQTVSKVTAEANAAYQRLLDADRPDSQYFYPWDGCDCA